MCKDPDTCLFLSHILAAPFISTPLPPLHPLCFILLPPTEQNFPIARSDHLFNHSRLSSTVSPCHLPASEDGANHPRSNTPSQSSFCLVVGRRQPQARLHTLRTRLIAFPERLNVSNSPAPAPAPRAQGVPCLCLRSALHRSRYQTPVDPRGNRCRRPARRSLAISKRTTCPIPAIDAERHTFLEENVARKWC